MVNKSSMLYMRASLPNQCRKGESAASNTTNPAFYFRFDDAGTLSSTDGAIGFRVRIGADKNPSGFDHFMGVGIDANADGALDLFLSVENSGNPNQLGIFDAGSGANTSPSTTTIVSSPLFSYALSVSNYNFGAVNATIDPKLENVVELGADFFVLPVQIRLRWVEQMQIPLAIWNPFPG